LTTFPTAFLPAARPASSDFLADALTDLTDGADLADLPALVDLADLVDLFIFAPLEELEGPALRALPAPVDRAAPRKGFFFADAPLDLAMPLLV
jgi:hypothetical protein